MPYANKTDMQARYEDQKLIELTDRVEPYQNIIIDSVMNIALDDASAVIDMYVGGRYKVPLSPAPQSLIKICCTLAYYGLHRGHHHDELRQTYEDALSYLEKIAAGKIELNQLGAEAPSATATAVVEAPDRIFNRDSLKVY